ncbi:hypothetical protein Scep_028111 [Stephania cephalantha]|uniref:Epoxide hydrolase n=1 Tax=Stephania cephalantha TaxID=152367 RepID=A0AAP0E9A6_9MAGN
MRGKRRPLVAGDSGGRHNWCEERRWEGAIGSGRHNREGRRRWEAQLRGATSGRGGRRRRRLVAVRGGGEDWWRWEAQLKGATAVGGTTKRATSRRDGRRRRRSVAVRGGGEDWWRWVERTCKVVDLETYAEHYKKSGFLTPMQVPYRSLRENIDVSNVVVEVPALLIMGEKDYTLKFSGMEEYLNETKAEDYVPNLKTVFLDEGTHFVHEQFPDSVSRLLIAFFDKCQTT